MVNKHIKDRLSGIQRMLMGAHHAGSPMTSASKGHEREVFINGFLSQVLPPSFRFGSGDAIDQAELRSGQLDIVVEYPFIPSLPIVAGRSPRLYLAEGIVAVIEIKSDLASQWEEVERTAEQLRKLTRKYTYPEGVSIGPRAIEKVPLYAVGYSGWKTFEKVKEKVDPAQGINGVLVIEQGHFFGICQYLDHEDKRKRLVCNLENTSMSLWGLITCIHYSGSMVTSVTKNVPRRYADIPRPVFE